MYVYMQSMHTHFVPASMPLEMVKNKYLSVQTNKKMAIEADLSHFHLSETTFSIHSSRMFYLKLLVPQFKRRKNKVIITLQNERRPDRFRFLSFVASYFCFSF